MTAKITYDTIETNAFNNLFELIDNRSNIPDPRDPDNQKIRRFVYDSDPFEKSIEGAPLEPYIVQPSPPRTW